MYLLPDPEFSCEEKAMAVVDHEVPGESELWHRRLGHINQRDLAKVYQHVDGVPKLPSSTAVCCTCRLGKAHKLPFPGHFRPAKHVGDLLHSDIVGPLVQHSWMKNRDTLWWLVCRVGVC